MNKRGHKISWEKNYFLEVVKKQKSYNNKKVAFAQKAVECEAIISEFKALSITKKESF
jgi:hypothetical protein